MSSPPQPPQPNCPIIMSDGKPCGRPLHRIKHGDDEEPVCLMHTHDPDKDWDAFWTEIQAILSGTSVRQPANNTRDFTTFVFTRDTDFSNANFTYDADFSSATFTHNADFSGATFTQDAYFSGASFTQDANFSFAKFTQDADFRSATFTERVDFPLTSFRQVADFRFATFEKPNRILFHRVNEEPPPGMTAPVGMKARFLNCLLDGVRFEDVHWHTPGGRLVLQDELDLEGESPPKHELVADAYRRLVNNFEKARQYELAEQCIVGEMEMRRRDPRHFLLASWAEKEKGPRWKFWRPLQRSIGQGLKQWYAKASLGRWLGEHFSFLYFYRALSTYGSNYARALFGLFALVFVLFPMLYGFTGLRLPDPHTLSGFTVRAASSRSDSFVPKEYASTKVNPEFLLISWAGASKRGQQNHALATEFSYVLWKGIVHSAEVVTLQRSPALEPASDGARLVAAFEIVAVPGQLALFLFALRRRFRR